MIQALPKLAAATTTAASADADGKGNQAKLKSAAQAFEAVFLRQMIGSMRKASLGDGMFDNEATQQFQDMADSKTADSMSSHGVLHIADMLVKQLSPQVARMDGTAAKADAGAHVTSLATAKAGAGAVP